MKILVVVPPERFDFYNYLSKLGNHEFVLLWHIDHNEMQLPLDDLPLKFDKIIFWNQFTTPKKLLQNVRPDKIIFFEIIDLRQIALIVAAKSLGISTFYLEHGAAGNRDAAIIRWNEQTFTKHKLPYLAKRLKNNLYDIVKAKLFYYSNVNGFDTLDSYKRYFITPFQMLRSLPNKVLSKNRFRERVPKYSIVFNQINFEQFELYTGISKEDALFTGLPQFDKFYSNQHREEDYVVFIDHPYLEEGILNWTPEHHKNISEVLSRFAESNKVKVYIKLHPISNIKNWECYNFNSKYIEIIQFGDFTDLYLKSKLILGFSSSLITGFLCAKKNVVLLGWHPTPHIFGMDFSKSGLCHTSLNIDDLIKKYNHWINENYCNDVDKYEAFLKECNYPFDGKATDRVLQAIQEL
jgi:hypothetical protein